MNNNYDEGALKDQYIEDMKNEVTEEIKQIQCECGNWHDEDNDCTETYNCSPIKEASQVIIHFKTIYGIASTGYYIVLESNDNLIEIEINNNIFIATDQALIRIELLENNDGKFYIYSCIWKANPGNTAGKYDNNDIAFSRMPAWIIIDGIDYVRNFKLEEK